MNDVRPLSLGGKKLLLGHERPAIKSGRRPVSYQKAVRRAVMVSLLIDKIAYLLLLKGQREAQR